MLLFIIFTGEYGGHFSQCREGTDAAGASPGYPGVHTPAVPGRGGFAA